MFTSIAKSIFGDSNERVIKKFQPLVEQINSLEPEIEVLDRDGIVALSNALRERAKSGEDLEALLPEAFATDQGFVGTSGQAQDSGPAEPATLVESQNLPSSEASQNVQDQKVTGQLLALRQSLMQQPPGP